MPIATPLAPHLPALAPGTAGQAVVGATRSHILAPRSLGVQKGTHQLERGFGPDGGQD